MYIFFMPLLLLPLIEIIGFLTIGAHIGFLWSVLWLTGSTMLGFYLLGTGGSVAWRRSRNGSEDPFVLQDAFDSLCVLIAALLLIFPGFISDFIAIPFLLAPVRHWLFGRAKSDPDSFMRRGYRSWNETRAKSTNQTIIEGEYRKIDEQIRPPE